MSDIAERVDKYYDNYNYLESMARDDTDVSGHPVSKLDFYHVSQHQLLSLYVQLVTGSHHHGKLQQPELPS